MWVRVPPPAPFSIFLSPGDDIVKRRKSTRTSSFGVKGRESHDSSPFYSRAIYSNFSLPKPSEEDLIENPLPENLLDKVIEGDAREVLKKIPDCSIHLMVTSPPYNVGKEYDEDMTLDEYLEFIEEIMKEVYRVLVWGGRACFNVANLGRKPYIPLHAYLIHLFEKIGFLIRGEIIWDKGEAVSGSSTAWGSWMSPVNPVLRDQHEYIIVMSKGDLKRRKPSDREAKSTITREEFLEFTRSVWKFPPESAKRVGHPAPFPEELPYRCIQLYTFKGDVVLDPFAGVGTTCVAAVKTGRHFVGIEINPEYVKKAEERVKDILSKPTLFEDHC
ncbi:m4C-methyltransferase [Thermotoga maritima MSB8]|uniref:Methyltransferase n=1 Tax=Thermotoga maritima (strain ATCC 43589 / DSM 3109 / JCM 10099 / NBRC 100826 / MSB8) TaxID=243274 RepID=Q9WYG3_THEMA|nr:m4C-methyltransferase [Thermotoga maritima MSB8]HAA83137.1 site-specific DNA-methyltransferase [Thermotoga petrophila]